MSLWASAPHAILCGFYVPATGHYACRYAHCEHFEELGYGGSEVCDTGSREESAGGAARALLCGAFQIDKNRKALTVEEYPHARRVLVPRSAVP